MKTYVVGSYYLFVCCCFVCGEKRQIPIHDGFKKRLTRTDEFKVYSNIGAQTWDPGNHVPMLHQPRYPAATDII